MSISFFDDFSNPWGGGGRGYIGQLKCTFRKSTFRKIFQFWGGEGDMGQLKSTFRKIYLWKNFPILVGEYIAKNQNVMLMQDSTKISFELENQRFSFHSISKTRNIGSQGRGGCRLPKTRMLRNL